MYGRLRAGSWPRLAALALAAVHLHADADQSIAVKSQLLAEVRVSAGTVHGHERYRFVPATLLSQGETVYYTLRITNPASVFADHVAVVQRIPQNTVYVAGSAAGPAADITFSVDGGQTFAPAERLTVEFEGATQPADPSAYTHIRWELRNPLAPGAVALARFQAVFN